MFRMNRTATNLLAGLIIWTLLSAAGLLLSWQQAIGTSQQSLREILTAQWVPQVIAPNGRRLDQYAVTETLLEQINQDLSSLAVTGRIPLIHSCSARLVSLHSRTEDTDTGSQSGLRVTSKNGDQFDFLLTCEPDYVNWLGSQLLLALFATLAILVLRRPLKPTERQWLNQLQPDYPKGEAASLCRTIASSSDQIQEQLALVRSHGASDLKDWLKQLLERPIEQTPDLLWLEIAAERFPSQPEHALHIAHHEPTLIFDPCNQQLWVHGLQIEMPITPYLYYLWYALQRLQSNEGWFINPATNKPDQQHAQQLALLMEQYGGHGRAINDLKTNGLKAKSLDQNRSRIKDELTRQLGEALATPYLFEAERDLPSGRLKYRIVLKAGAIKV